MSPEQRTLRIVVIEDNTPDVMLIGETLRGSAIPYEIVHFKDGAEAISGLTDASAKQEPLPDLIMLDLNMPKVNGLEVLQAIKKLDSLAHVPVVVLTSSLAPDEKQEAERLGAARYLRKPLDLYDFLDQVGTIVRELIPAAKEHAS